MLRRFFDWWTDELVSLMPASWQPAAHDANQGLVLTIGETMVELTDTGTRVDDARRDNSGEMAAIRDLLAAKLQAGHTEVTVCLEPELVVEKELTLPAAAVDTLASVVGFEMQKHTPFRAEDVYYDCHVSSRNRAAREVLVLVRFAPKRVIRSLIPEALSEAQTVPAEVQGFDSGSLKITLASKPKSTNRRTRVRALLLINAILVFVTVGLAFFYQQRALSEANALLANERLRAQESGELAEQLAQLDARVTALYAYKTTELSLTVLLNELAARLPDSTWLHEIDVRERQLRIRGLSASASLLIGVLESSELLENVRFQSPVTDDGSTHQERFEISADIKEQAEQSEGAG